MPTTAPVEACPSCGSPMAADQRYCLECGLRRGQSSLPFVGILRGDAGPAHEHVPAPLPVHVAALAQPAPLIPRNVNTLLAGIGVLLLAMGVGVLIGRSSRSDASSAAAPAPQVINLGGATGAAAAPAATTPAPVATTPAPVTTTPSKAKAKAPAAVKQLDTTNTKDYQKKSKALPKTVGTGGKAPPVTKKKKPASDFQTIG